MRLSASLLSAVHLIAYAYPPASQAARPIQIPLQPQDHSQGYEFDPLLHLPGISPYFDAVGFGLKHDAPEGCRVTTASYLIRHTAIYANEAEYDEYIKPFLWKLEQHRGAFTGPLAFLNAWVSPIDEDHLEDITPRGAEDATEVGRHLLKRYPELVPSTKRILADNKARTFDTAQAFVKAFPQNQDDIEVLRFSKPKDGSMNPIIPHKSCKGFTKEPGTKEMAEFVHRYASRASARLRPFMPFSLADKDVVAMQSVCGYESAITGQVSPLCAVFTDAEWMGYEYAWDLRYAHMVGPLNPISDYLGFPWLDAQAKLLQDIDNVPDNIGFDIRGNQVHHTRNESGHMVPSFDTDNDSDPGSWPPAQRFFLSFTHREVPPLIATALGIFNSSFEAKQQFPTDHIVWTRAWKMSDLIPFLGHVGLEKMVCDRPGGLMSGEFVRVIANTAPRPIPRCQWGPGASCALEDFVKIVKDGAEEFKDWHSVCGMKD